MGAGYLPPHATIEEACEWLHATTGEQWTLARILESGAMPWFWLDHKAGYPAIFNGRTEGYLAPLVYQGDLSRLMVDGREVLITMTRTHQGTLLKIEPGIRAPVSELRFKREDIEALASSAKARNSAPDSTGADGLDDSLRDAVREQVYNGEPVDWSALVGYTNLTPLQAALAALRIDPFRWPDGKGHAQGEMRPEFRERFVRREQWLRDKRSHWSLRQLVEALGDDAPEGMRAAVQAEGALVAAGAEGGPQEGPATNVHRLQSRRNDLDPAIDAARARASNPKDHAAVWVAFVALADSAERPAPLLGVADGEVKYRDDKAENGVGFINRDAFQKRLKRADKRR